MVKLTPKGLICYLVGLVVETALGQIHSSAIQQGFWLTHCQLFGIWETLYRYCTCMSLVTAVCPVCPAPQGQPGCGLTVWSYQVVVATVMFAGLSRGGVYTLRWLAVWSCLLSWLHQCWGCRHNVGQPRVRVSGLPPGSCQAIMYQWKMEAAGTSGVSGTSGLPQVGVKQLLCCGTLLAR